MTDIDFDGIRAELVCAITALNRAKDALKDDYSNPAVCARVDLQHTIRDLSRAMGQLETTEQILKGTNK